MGTIIEKIVVVIIAVVVFSIVYIGVSGSNTKTSFGVNGYVEIRCVEGLKFSVGADGSVRQIIDEQGRAKTCR